MRLLAFTLGIRVTFAHAFFHVTSLPNHPVETIEAHSSTPRDARGNPPVPVPAGVAFVHPSGTKSPQGSSLDAGSFPTLGE